MTFYFGRGTHSWELQIGTLVIQVRRRNINHSAVGFTYKPKLVAIWRDPYGTWR